MTEKLKKILFQKYLNNDCSEEEWQKVRACFSDSTSDHILHQLIELEMQKYLLKEVSIDQKLSEEMLGNIIGKINKDEDTKGTALKVKPFRFSYHRKSFQIAASTLFIVAISFSIFLSSKKKFMAGTAVVYIERTTAIGESLQVDLPDGSTVWLNNASKIKYPKDFSSRAREVFLEGEAYFDVANDTSKPFIVHTAGIQTKVLGTSFNINAYDELSSVEVSVIKGKVEVSDSLNSFGVLEKDQQITIDKHSKGFLTNEGKSRSAIGWREGRLIFDQATFREIKSVLHKKYGVAIEFENEQLKNCRFTAEFGKDDKPLAILDMLNLLHGTSYRTENNVIIISGNGCETNLN